MDRVKELLSVAGSVAFLVAWVVVLGGAMLGYNMLGFLGIDREPTESGGAISEPDKIQTDVSDRELLQRIHDVDALIDRLEDLSAGATVVRSGYLTGWDITFDGRVSCDGAYVWSATREIECDSSAGPTVVGFGYLTSWNVVIGGRVLCYDPFIWSATGEIECD